MSPAVVERPRRVRIAQAVEIDVPLPDVRTQWSCFEWRREIAGRGIDWSAVRFASLEDARTSAALELDLGPIGLLERLGCSLGSTASAVARELHRFKRTIETARHLLACRDLRRSELARYRALTVDAEDAPRGARPQPIA